MRIFCNWEFVERGSQLPLQPVSVGMIREDGVELYAINEESLSNVAKHPWLSVNVGPYLPMMSPNVGIIAWDEKHPEYQYVCSLDQLTGQVRKFITETPSAELWADYGAHGHVVLCQLFGTMAELPAGIPMFTHELQQLWEEAGRPDLPPQPWRAHHAMEDARWTRDAYNVITNAPATISGTTQTVDAEIIEGVIE
jgi:hypothetical protein